MAKNFGKTHYKMFELPAVFAPKAKDDDPDIVIQPGMKLGQQTAANGAPWKDVAKEQAGTWFIAVDDSGYILCCERDPTMVAVVDHDIWQIEHPGPREAIHMKFWDGKKVIDGKPDGFGGKL